MRLYVCILRAEQFFCPVSCDIFRDVNIPVVSIIWTYYGLPAEEFDQRITTYSEYSLTGNVNDIERTLLPAVRGAGRRAALVNASGRVVVASDSSRPTGSLIRPATWAEHDRVVPCDNGLALLIDAD